MSAEDKYRKSPPAASSGKSAFHIVPDGGGFHVLWVVTKPDAEDLVLQRVTGFATHDQAQQFIRDFLIQLVKSGRPTS